MSWFSNQWNRWSQSAPSAWSDVEWLDVVYGRQRYQVSLPQIQGALTLGHLRQELASVFSLPVQQVLIVFQGMFLKDDRVSLRDYGLQSGSRITLVARDAYAQQAQARAQASRAAPQGGAAGGPSAPSSESLPTAAPTMAPVARGHASRGAPPAQESGAGAAAPEAPAVPASTSHLQQIAQVSQHCQQVLVPELELFEKTVDTLPDAPAGALQSQPSPDTASTGNEAAIPPQRVPLTQRKLSELLLRELLKLDGIPTDSEEVRNMRKATVKEIQTYLDRVDAAWHRATQAKGIVSDV